MQNHNNTAEADVEIQAEPSPEPSQMESAEAVPWHVAVGQLLSHAAQLCVEQGIDLESFLKGAWSAYVEARPGMRDYLEEMQLRDQLDEIRKLGQMAQA